MAFKDFHQKVKKVYNYINKVLSYACIVILVCIALFFVSYFIESAIAKSKGQKYVPRISLYTIVSPSMTPTIKVYDVIFDVRTSPDKIKKGDVITFTSSSFISRGLTVTHRVVKVNKTEDGTYEFVTKGDNNPFNDGAVALGENLIGKVVFKIPQLGRIQIFLQSRMGWLFCILIPALIVIIYDIFKLKRAMKINSVSKELVDKKNAEVIKPTSEEIKEKILANREIINNTVSINNDYELPKPVVENNNDLPIIKEDDELPKTSENSDDDFDLPKLK